MYILHSFLYLWDIILHIYNVRNAFSYFLSDTMYCVCGGGIIAGEMCLDNPFPPTCNFSGFTGSDLAGFCERTCATLLCDASTKGKVKDTCRISCSICNAAFPQQPNNILQPTINIIPKDPTIFLNEARMNLHFPMTLLFIKTI